MAGEPSIVSGVAGRYAGALFELAEGKGQAEAVMAQLDAFSKALETSPDLSRLVRSPVFSAEAQRGALTKLLPKLGISGIAANLFQLLAQNRRLFLAADIVTAFHALLLAKRGAANAEVTSAEPLSDTQSAALRAALKGATGKDVNIAARVDPALIGGLVVKFGSRMIDTSLRTKLAQLKLALKEVR